MPKKQKENKSILRPYLERQPQFVPGISGLPAHNLNYCIVIPCYNERELTGTLSSVFSTSPIDCATEIIVVVNSPVNATDDVLTQNLKAIDEIRKWKQKNTNPNISLEFLHITNIPKKMAGAGFARKAGMDEAIYRFNLVNQTEGVIISLDADTLVEKNYLRQIDRFYNIYPGAAGCNVNFAHRIEELEDNGHKLAIIKYELYIRYFKEALKITGFPYPFYTIGSCFTVKADTYCKQGGMNTRTAGEDFYFLQKIFYLDRFYELNSAFVYPSARISDRVIFGTGPALQRITGEHNEYKVYSFASFLLLQKFFTYIGQYYLNRDILKQLENDRVFTCLLDFLVPFNYAGKLKEIYQNVSNETMYRKRLYQTFNNFFIVKALNHLARKGFPKESIEKSAVETLKFKHVICENNPELLLKGFRELQNNAPVILPQ